MKRYEQLQEQADEAQAQKIAILLQAIPEGPLRDAALKDLGGLMALQAQTDGQWREISELASKMASKEPSSAD